MPNSIVCGAVLLAAAALTVLACEEAQQTRLDDSNPATRVSLQETSGGEDLRVCVESAGGRPVDYYFTSQAAATGWMFAAALHYAFSNQPFNQPPSVYYRSKIGTTGFTDEFEVTDGQAESAGNSFAVIVHATSACLGSSNSCVVDVAVHSIQLRSWIAIIIGVVIIAAIIGGIVVCSYFCCCRKPQHPQQQAGVEGAQQVQVQGQVVDAQPVGSPTTTQQQYQQQPGPYPPPQQQGYPPQPGCAYAPQQQISGGYAPQQPGGYPMQPHQAPGPGYPAQPSGAYPPPPPPTSQGEEMRPLASAEEPPVAQHESTPGRV